MPDNDRHNGLLTYRPLPSAPLPSAPPGYAYSPTPDGWTIQSGSPGLGVSHGKLAEALLSLAPGSGEVMDAMGSIEAGREAWDSLRAGDYGDAAGHYAGSVASGLGAVPLLGLGVRGVRKGARALADLLADTVRRERTIDNTGKAADAVALPQTIGGLGDD